MSRVEEEGLLSRWSRRKLQSPEETAEEDHELEIIEEPASEQVAASVEDVEQPVLTDADMPPIESLNEESDFSMFMSSGVSDKLRNLALRKMFHVPAFNIRDGLDEYDEDFTTFEALGDIVTCDMKHQIEMQEKKKAEQEAEQAALADETEEMQLDSEEVTPEMDDAELDDAELDAAELDDALGLEDPTSPVDEETTNLESEKI